MRLESNIYFYLVVRILCAINCLIMLFCIALSSGWTSRLAPVIGLIFNLLSLLFIGGAIATLFAWKLEEMSLPKRCIFMLVFMMLSIITGVMFVIAPSICDAYNKYGCFQTYYSGGYKVAAAFAFISVAFSLIDMILNFFFYYRRHTVIPTTTPAPHFPKEAASPTPSILKKKSSVFVDEDFYNDFSRPHTGHSTEV